MPSHSYTRLRCSLLHLLSTLAISATPVLCTLLVPSVLRLLMFFGKWRRLTSTTLIAASIRSTRTRGSVGQCGSLCWEITISKCTTLNRKGDVLAYVLFLFMTYCCSCNQEIFHFLGQILRSGRSICPEVLGPIKWCALTGRNATFMHMALVSRSLIFSCSALC